MRASRWWLPLAVALAAPAAAQTIRYLSTEEALALEHDTRYQRLRRFAQSFGVRSEPELRDYIVPAAAMPPEFKHDVPVLRIIFPETTFFDTASAEIKPSAVPIIRTMAGVLDGDVPDVSAFVAGHTDSRGSPAYNHNLSIRRARAVAELLTALRDKPGPLLSIGFGESVPLYPNTSDENLARNRRVEFLLAARIEAVANWLQDQAIDVCRTNDEVERVRCMVAFQREPKRFVAVPVERKVLAAPTPGAAAAAVAPPEAGPKKVTPQGDARVGVTPPRDKPIYVDLNERPVYVRTMEH